MITLEAGERITCTLETAPWGGAPDEVRVRVYDITRGEPKDVSGTALHGRARVAGDVITLPALGPLQAGRVYRLEVRFTSQGEVYECSGEWQAG